MLRSIFLLCLLPGLLLLAPACDSDEGDSTDASPADTTTTLDPRCPPGPMSPLGDPCQDDGLLCNYGFDPAECGGVSFQCSGGEFVEESRTSPTDACIGGGLTCGQVCEKRAECDSGAPSDAECENTCESSVFIRDCLAECDLTADCSTYDSCSQTCLEIK